MTRVRKTYALIALIGICGFLFIWSGCSEKIVNEQSDSAVKIPLAAKPNAVDYFTLTVNAPDMETISTIMVWQDGYLMAEIEIPLGANRTLVAEGFSSEGQLLYRGETTVDIWGSDAIVIDIDLYPAISMLRPNPYYTRVLTDSTYVVDICAYEIVDLHEVEMNVGFMGEVPVAIDSIVTSEDLPEGATLSYEHGQDASFSWVNIYGVLTDTTFDMPIVDENGNGCLFRIYFKTWSNWTDDSLRLNIVISDLTMLDIYRDPLTGPTIEDGAIDLIRGGRNEAFFGGSGSETANSVIQTSDGGYLLAGYTSSIGAGSNDIYVVKTDSKGDLEWEQSIGASGSDLGHKIIESSDGFYYVTGQLYNVYWDFYLARLDQSGGIVWDDIYDGSKMGDGGFDLVATADAGCVVAGYSIQGSYYKVLARRYYSNGEQNWTQILGEADADYAANAIAQIDDTTYVIAGRSDAGSAGNYDAMLMKIGPRGVHNWTMLFGGTETDEANDILVANDGGFVLCGKTRSSGAGLDDIYIIKTDADGNEVWSQTYGGTGIDYGNEILATGDGGYIVVGTSNSQGDSSGIYVMKIDASGNLLWDKALGIPESDGGNSIYPTSDGGYIIGGSSSELGSSDAYILKIDGDGNAR